MSGLMSIVGSFGLWIVFELIGEVLAPVLRPVGRAVGRMTNRWTVGVVWMCAAASIASIPYIPASADSAVQALWLAAIMGLTPLALMGTFELRDRRRAARARMAPAQPRPAPVWHPAARVNRR